MRSSLTVSELAAAAASDPDRLLHDDECEQALVRRAVDDPDAFASLYRRHAGRLLGYVYARVGDRHLAEDLVSDVFVSAWRSLPRFRFRGVPLHAWLLRIAANRVNRWAVRERRQALRAIEEEPATESRLGDDAARSRTRLALLTLPVVQQEVLTLHYLEGLSIEEIACAVGCRVGTVKSRLSRGREALRRKLDTSRRSS